MYCGKCGKHNPEDSVFCQSCGSKIIKTSVESKTNKESEAEVSSPEIKNKEVLQNNKKVNAGLGGWLFFVGVGLIIIPFFQGPNIMNYLSLLNQTYDIPGYMTLLRLEFVSSIVIFIASIYLLFFYFKKKVKFPKYYIIYIGATTAYAILDYLFLASLTAQTSEQQKIIADTLSKYSGEVGKSIFFAIIWILYMKKSKRVKATFINK
jgi:hypothetical protein